MKKPFVVIKKRRWPKKPVEVQVCEPAYADGYNYQPTAKPKKKTKQKSKGLQYAESWRPWI